MYPTDCTFYLCRADEYANSVSGLTQNDPEVLETFDLDVRHSTEESLLAYLKEQDALSWATLRLNAAVVICKPHYGHVALVRPLPPLVRREIVTVLRDGSDPQGLYVEASYWAGGMFNGMTALLTVSYELGEKLNAEVDKLWGDLDGRMFRRDSDEYRRTEQRIKRLQTLEHKVKDALTEGIAYIIVEAFR